MNKPLDNQYLSNLGFLCAIVGGLTLGPAIGLTFGEVSAPGGGAIAISAITAAGGVLVGLLSNCWAAKIWQKHAAKLAGPEYVQPKNDLTRLLSDAIVRVLKDCSGAQPEHAQWFDAIGTSAKNHYFGLSTHPALIDVHTNRLPLLFEHAARADRRPAVELLDEPHVVAGETRTVAYALLEYLRDISTIIPNGTAQTLAEKAIIHGLFAAIREMLKRSPNGRSYAALQIDTSGEILARLAELLKDWKATGATKDEIARLERNIVGLLEDLRSQMTDENQRSMQLVFDRFRRAEEQFDIILFEAFRIHERQVEHSEDHKQHDAAHGALRESFDELRAAGFAPKLRSLIIPPGGEPGTLRGARRIEFRLRETEIRALRGFLESDKRVSWQLWYGAAGL